MSLDPTFYELANEAIDKADEAMRTFYSLRPEAQTPAAVNSMARALKEAAAPLQQYVRILKMRAKALKMRAKQGGLNANTHGT
jgi:hypothetical protein